MTSHAFEKIKAGLEDAIAGNVTFHERPTMTPHVEAVATAICQALGLNPLEPISPQPGLPGLRWTQFVTAADAALSKAREVEPAPPWKAEQEFITPTAEQSAVLEARQPLSIDPGDTSERVAAIAARLMHHEDEDVRIVAASALGQCA